MSACSHALDGDALRLNRRITSIPARARMALLATALINSACGDTKPPSPEDGDDGGTGGVSASAAGLGGEAGAAAGQSAIGGSGGGPNGSAGSAGTDASGTTALPPFQIAASLHGTCALAGDGTVHCWGLAPEVWQVPNGAFIELHGGTDGVICAVRADRSVACFPEPLGMQDLSRQPSVKVQLLAVGEGAICGTDTDHAAFCNPTNVVFKLEPPTEALTSLSVGAQFACAVSELDGKLSCVGAATFGNCTFSPPFGQLDAPDGNYLEVTSGRYNSCAIRVDGTLACWGMGKRGDTAGAPCLSDRSAGQSEPPEGTFHSVRASEVHACGIRTDGTVACWGQGTEDECVDGACRQARPPVGVFDQLALGLYHSCGVKPDRTVECWGFDGDETLMPPAVFQ